jgi:S-methylmethionine-dependent homocysteine/selenocysteine methylase
MLAGMTGVTLLDGGMGQELIRHSSRAPSPLWSAQVMLDEPDLVRDVHRAYLDAGAEVITVNAYSATRCRLEPHGRGDDYERLQLLACRLAAEARADRAGARIAGCLSPYGWTYHPELAPPYGELWPRYAETATLQAPHVDLILCETMGSVEEARAAARGAATTGLPVWVSWSLIDDDTARLRSGEPLAEALAAFDGVDVETLLVNCSTPEAISAAIPVLAASGRAFGAYANGFHRIVDDYLPGSVVTDLSGRDDLDPATYADIVARWVDAGATVVGGCCEIGPEHIAELAKRFAAPVS